MPTPADQPITSPQALAATATGGWFSGYRLRVIATDVVVVAFAVAAPLLYQRVTGQPHARIPFLILAALLWLIALAMFDSRRSKILGTGSHEYKAVVDASVLAFGVAVVASFLFDMSIRRVDVLPTIPLGLVLLLVGRWSWRQWLHRERLAGRALNRVLLVGSPGTIRHTEAQFARHPESGYLVVGSIVPSPDDESRPGTTIHTEVQGEVERTGADIVMLTNSDALTPERIRRLGWDLERHRHGLVVATSLTDIAAGRIQTQPVAGLPLIHVEAPTYTGVQRTAKRLFDVVGSGILIALLSPVLAVTAVLVKTTSRGPVFYLQERIGRDNQPFAILKYRSMVADADARLHSLLAEQGTNDRPLFKIQKDPRLTKVGAVLRRYSIDELPQLFNVLKGDMSLVGPRPQRPAEVALYDHAAFRRLNVAPGMTGLWQVSGRSRLSWEEAIRLDLYYIENWTLLVDLVILWRTVRAVVGSDGAY